MKKLLIMLALLLFPVSTSARYSGPSFWFCKAVGNIGQQSVMIISHTWSDTYPNHYRQRETAFQKYVKNVTQGTFKPSFDAKCRDYRKPKRVDKHRVQEMKTAKRYEFDVKQINWRWTPNAQKKLK